MAVLSHNEMAAHRRRLAACQHANEVALRVRQERIWEALFLGRCRWDDGVRHGSVVDGQHQT